MEAKKGLPDAAALEAREAELIELATGWVGTDPLWLTGSLMWRRSQVVGGLALLQSLPFWAILFFRDQVVPLLCVWMAGQVFALGVPRLVEDDLSGEREDGELVVLTDLLLATPGAARQAFTQYYFHLDELAVPGCWMIATPVIVGAIAATFDGLLPAPLGHAAELACVLAWFALGGAYLLDNLLVPFFLSFPAQLLGFPGSAAHHRTKAITKRVGTSLIAFAAPVLVALGAFQLGTLAIFFSSPILGHLVFPLLASLGLHAFVATWTYRFLFELRRERLAPSEGRGCLE